jgi:hypothetical protein
VARVFLSARLRRLVIERAGSRCEYCRLHQQHAHIRHNVDHIIPLKHEGLTEADNLALACVDCNRYKGSDIAVLDSETGELVRLFNPRQDEWGEHFALEGAEIIGLTSIGRGTVALLRMNEQWRVEQRTHLLKIGAYPID